MNLQTKTSAYAGTTVDAGLQSFMQRVYNTMVLGLVVTGVVAFAVANTPALMQLVFGTPLKWVAMLAPLAYIWFGFTPRRVMGMDASRVKFHFVLFSALMGLSFSVIFVAFTGASIARVFMITAATFAGMSLYGYTTKRSLAGMGSFLFMGLMGIVIASLVNIFLGSSMVQFVVSILGVAIFTGLTAWETQNLKETYRAGGGAANDKVAYMGALSLYLNFINLFQSLLHLMGDRR